MSFLPLLCAPAGVGLTLLAKRQGWDWLLHKPYHEWVAIPLLAFTTLLMLRAWLRARTSLFLALTLLAAVFLCREIHFEGSGRLAYLTGLFIALWMWRRWPEMRAALVAWTARGWLVGSFACYALSLVVARRAFKSIPGEKGMHAPIEELLETVAHLLFLVAALRSGARSTAQALERATGAAPTASI
jgi:hypothetical protein